RHEGTDQMGHAAAFPGVLETAAQRLTVDAHQGSTAGHGQRFGPSHETAFEGLRGQQTKDPPESVMRGNAAGQLQKALEEFPLGLAELLDLYPPVGPADDGAHGDDDQIAEVVQLVVPTRIGHVVEIMEKTSFQKSAASAHRLGIHAKAPFWAQELSNTARPTRTMCGFYQNPRAGATLTCAELIQIRD